MAITIPADEIGTAEKRKATSTPDLDVLRNVRARHSCANGGSAISSQLVSLRDKELQIHLNVLSNIPVELSFFAETAREIVKICAPERQFEGTALDDLVRLLREQGASEEKINGATIVLKRALKDYLTDKFLTRIGGRLRDLSAVKEVVVKIVDAAGVSADGDGIPEDFRKGLLELFDKFMDGRAVESNRQHAPNTMATPESPLQTGSQYSGQVQAVNGTEKSRKYSEDITTEDPASHIHYEHSDARPDSITMPSTNGYLEKEAMQRVPIDELINQERAKSNNLHAASGNSTVQAQNSITTASTTTTTTTTTRNPAKPSPSIPSIATNPDRPIRGLALTEAFTTSIYQQQSPIHHPSSPAFYPPLHSPDRSRNHLTHSPSKFLPPLAALLSPKIPTNHGHDLYRPSYDIPDSEQTCWYWLTGRPPCKFRNSADCGHAHDLRDYVQGHHGRAPTLRGGQIRVQDGLHFTSNTTTKNNQITAEEVAPQQLLPAIKMEPTTSPTAAALKAMLTKPPPSLTPKTSVSKAEAKTHHTEHKLASAKAVQPPQGPNHSSRGGRGGSRSIRSAKQLAVTCPYWYEGHCIKDAGECHFAHEITGSVSHKPRGAR